MAPDNDNDVTLKFKQTGAEGVAKAIGGINDQLLEFKRRTALLGDVDPFKAMREGGGKDFGFQKIQAQIKGTVEGFKGLGDGSNLLTRALNGLQGGVNNISAALKSGGASTGLFTVGLDTLSQSLTLVRNPAVLAATAIAAIALHLNNTANEALNTAVALRQLAALTGDSAAKSEDLAGAFERLGVSQQAFNVGLFRMGSEIETGGKGLQALGINIRDANGEIKSAGTVLREMRDVISSLPDASARAAAASQILGSRLGKEYAEALGVSKKEFESILMQQAEYGSATPGFLQAARATEKAWKDVADAQKMYQSRLAETLAFPMSEMLANWTLKWLKFKEVIIDVGVTIAKYTVGLPGQLSKLIFGEDKRPAKGTDLGPADVPETTKKKAVTDRLTPGEAAERIQEINLENDFQQRLLKMRAQFAAEKDKIERGSASAGIALQLRMNEELVKAENDRYEQVVEFRRRTQLIAGVDRDPKEAERLEKEHQTKLLEIETEGNRLRLQQQQAFADEYRQQMEQRLQAEQASTERSTAILKTAYAAQRAVISLFSENRAQESRDTLRAEESDAKQAADVRMQSIRRQESELRDFAARFPALHQVQIDVANRLMDLSKQRVGVEQETNQKLIESRRAYLDQVKQMADQEASIGESIEQKAVARLQKRGRKRITADDIARERARMGDEAVDTFNRFSSGGAVDADRLMEARQFGRQRAQLNELGSNEAGASRMFNAQQAAAFGGRRFSAIPTALQGQAGEIQAMAQSLMEIAGRASQSTAALTEGTTKIVERVQKSEETFTVKLTEVGEAFAGVVERLPDVVIDKIIRKAEQQVARF